MNLNTKKYKQFYYHSDHTSATLSAGLGSSSFISDRDGTAIQHLQYLPYGETFINQTSATLSYQSRYTFSGKEKDTETDYGYFGAKYLMSDISMWISVDPMADKYPYQSPYSYVGWRPINFIDPNGEDEWEINEQGKITKHIANDKKDGFYMVDKDGKRIDGKSIEFKYGTVKGQFNKKLFNTEKINNKSKTSSANVHFFKIKGDKESKEAFDFFAENTQVEWSQTFTGKQNGDDGISYLSNSEKKDSEWGAGHLLNIGLLFRGHNHSHPYNYEPSDGDKKFAKSVHAKFKEIPLNINYEGWYFNYNNDGLTPSGEASKLIYNEFKNFKWK